MPFVTSQGAQKPLSGQWSQPSDVFCLRLGSAPPSKYVEGLMRYQEAANKGLKTHSWFQTGGKKTNVRIPAQQSCEAAAYHNGPAANRRRAEPRAGRHFLPLVLR